MTLRRKKAVCIPFVVALALLCGCANVSNDSSPESSSSSLSEAANDISAVDKESSTYKIIEIEDVPNQELTSAYIDVAGSGSCIKLENNYGQYGISYEANVHPVVTDVTTNSDSILYELSPESGDRLITTIPAGAEYVTVVDQGFIGGTKTDTFVKDTEVNGIRLASKDIEGELETILNPDDIEVLTLNASPNMEKNFGIANVFFSHSISIVTYGSYIGTKWVDDSFKIDIPVYIADSSQAERIELPQEKTKEGYFVIDYSSLPKGDYVIWSGNVGSLIRIV